MRIRLPLFVLVPLVLAGACSKDPEVAKREFVASGDRYMEEGKLPEAIIEYRNAVQQDPLYGEARSKLATAHRQNRDLVAALPEAVRAADLLSEDAEAQVAAGELLLLAARFSDAQARADKALAARPTHVPALILRANALAGLRRVDDAIADVEEAIRLDPTVITSYSSLGFLELVRGDRTNAEAAFLKALEVDPRSVLARLALAHFYWSVGRRADAEEQLRATLSIEASNPVANRMMAMLMIGSGRVADAEQYLKAMAEGDPSVTGRLVLADYYVAGRRLDDARRVLTETAAVSSEGFIKATLRLAGIGAVTRDLATSRRLVDEVLAKDGTNVEALLVKTIMLLGANEIDGARASVDTAVRTEPWNASTHFMLGQVRLRQGDVDGAIAALNEALRLNPGMTSAELELSNIHFSTGRLDDAEQFARAAATRVRGAVNAHLMLSRIQLARRDLAAAEPTLRALERALPKHPDVLAALGDLEVAKRNWTAARALYARALAENQDHFEGLRGILAVDAQLKRPAEVRSRLSEVLRNGSAEPRLLLLAGRVYSVIGDTADAEAMWRRTIEADPDNLQAYVELSRLYHAQKRVAEATAKMTEFVTLRPESIAGHTLLGMMLQAQGRIDEATAQYEAAVSANPEAAVAANNLAEIYLAKGTDLNRALQLAQVAKARLPNEPAVSDTLGWAYYRRGLFDRAAVAMGEAVRLNSENPRFHYRLGLAQLGAGNQTAARSSFSKSLALGKPFDGADDARAKLASLN